MNLCLICLRTDRSLKLASDMLEDFHDELCDFSVITITSSFYYCSECEYLLRKFHRFKEKCVEALKVLKTWISTKNSNKHPIHLLYTLVPPSTLGMWVPNPQKIGNYNFESMDIQAEICIEEEPMKDSKEVKIEYDDSQWNSTDKISTSVNIFKTENISGNDAESYTDQSSNDLKTEEPTTATTAKRKINARTRKTEASNTATTAKRKTNAKIAEELNATTKKRKNIDRETERRELLETLDKLLNDDSDSTDTDDAKLESIDEKVLALLKPKTTRRKATPKKDQHQQVRETDKRHESVFDIEYLSTKEMQIEEFQRRKTYECYVKAEHKCEICYQVFKSSKFLKYHTNKWHTETPDKVCCPICQIWSQSRAHRLTHGAVFKCKLCPLVTYHRETMHNHYEWHKGKQYRCGQCDTVLKSMSAYRSHMGKVHRRGRNVCDCCGRGFNSPAGLRIHKNNSMRCALENRERSEAEVERVRCEECDVTFPSQMVYTSHMADVHISHGAKRQVDSAGLPKPTGNREPRSRKGKCVKPGRLTCQICNSVGGSYGWLQLHFKREHPNDDLDLLYADKRKHLCDICGTGFCNVYALRDHMNVHTGARPHACDLCPKTFRSGPLMRNHRLRHFPSGYQCAHCGKRFKTSSNLYNHAKAHTGEKNYDCEICGKAFLHRNSLNEHIRGVHYNIRRVKRGGDAGAREVKRRKTYAEERDSDFDDSRD